MVNYTKIGTIGTKSKAIDLLKTIKKNNQYVKNNDFRVFLDTLTIQKLQKKYAGKTTNECIEKLVHNVLNIKLVCFVCEKEINNESYVYHHLLYSRNDLYGNGVTVPVHKIKCHSKAYQFNYRTSELRKSIWKSNYKYRTLKEAEDKFREFIDSL